MCSVLGMHVRTKNPRSRDKTTKLYMCNHVTEFDHNIINLLTPCHTVSVCLLDGLNHVSVSCASVHLWVSVLMQLWHYFWFNQCWYCFCWMKCWWDALFLSAPLAPVRGLHRLCVLGQRLHGDPFSIWPGSHRRHSPEVLLHWGHLPAAPVPRRGDHQRPRWPAEVQVSAIRICLMFD